MIGVTGISSGLGRFLSANLRGAYPIERELYGKRKFDVIVHCGIIPVGQSQNYFLENLGLFRRLNMSPETRIIFMSSVDVYDRHSEYGQMKLAMENYITKKHPNTSVILRSGFLVGNSNRRNHLLKMIEGSDIGLSEISTFSYVSHHSALETIEQLINCPLNGTYNLVSQPPTITLAEVGKLIGYRGAFGNHDYHTKIDSTKNLEGSSHNRVKDGLFEIKGGWVNLLILGASGFIGRNCLNYFSTLNNVNVTGVTHSRSITINPGCRIVTGDLLSKQFVDSIITPDVDVILQFAATTSGARDIVERPHIHTADNAIMNSLVFRRAHEVGVQKLVFPSCSVMYQSSSTPLKESDYDPSSSLVKAYFGVGSTKLYLEKMCEFYGSLGRTRFIALRHSNLYGPYDKYDLDRSHFTGATLRKVLDAEEGGTIRVWGDGSTRRDLLYVDDFVRAIELTLDKVNDNFNLFNVGSGVDYSVTEVIERIVRISGKSLKLEYDTSMPTIKTGLSLDCSRFTQATGWSPSTSLEVGLNLSYEWLSAALS